MARSTTRGAAALGATLISTLLLVMTPRPFNAAGEERSRPGATLVDAAVLRLPGSVDSSSPVVWDVFRGRPVLHVLTSITGRPSRSAGADLTRMTAPQPVNFVSHPGHGVWMESVITDASGMWYGYYHNEVPADFCNRPDRMMPRIGAARSTDRGRTWEDLGIILEAPPGAHHCATPNRYFVGGVGDVSAILDADAKYLYLFFSQYSRSPAAQGVAVGRLPWAARDKPAGRVDVWAGGAWLPATAEGREVPEGVQFHWRYSAGTPLVQPTRPWHDAEPSTDAFWGATAHWNTYLRQYVMLLNRAKDEAFGQEGIYISFAQSLDEPGGWSAPERIVSGGSWYPQIIGLEPGEGTDKQAGARARFFMSGESRHFIDFTYMAAVPRGSVK